MATPNSRLLPDALGFQVRRAHRAAKPERWDLQGDAENAEKEYRWMENLQPRPQVQRRRSVPDLLAW